MRPLTLLKRFRRRSRSFQEKRGNTAERWALFKDHLPAKGSVLDVGCDEGQFTELCARQGMFSLGVERASTVHLASKAYVSEGLKICFMQADVDESFFSTIPAFDCILFLSVHHHFWRHGGRPLAESIFRLAAKKTATMIYEAPIRTSRYKPKGSTMDIPDFVDLNPTSAAEWYQNWLSSVVPGVAIKLLGFSPCVGEREPIRPVFHLRFIAPQSDT